MTHIARAGFIPLAIVIIAAISAKSTCAAADDALPADVTLVHNLRYREGASAAWVLDLAMPKEKAAAPRPAIVVIHGGGWLEGDKSSFSTPKNRPPGNIIDFAKLGFVAVTINYRLSKEAPYPAALDDCRAAVRWLRANADKYQIDPARIGAWGNSAGGHLALMLGLAGDGVKQEANAPHAAQSSAVQAVVSDSGPIDLAWQHDHNQVRGAIEQFMAGPPTGDRLATYKQASPSSHVSARSPPLLLIYGGADSQVGVDTADRFVEALDKAGVKDMSYLRLGKVDHCPHSLIRVPWVDTAVNAFFVRTLRAGK